MTINQQEMREAFLQAQGIVTHEWESKVDVPNEMELKQDWEKLYEEGQKKKRKVLSGFQKGMRVAMVVMLVLVVGVSSVFSVEASRKAVLTWFTKWTQKEDNFHFEGEKGDGVSKPPQKIETVYEPSYIPNGFELADGGLVGDIYYSLEYIKGKNYLGFEQNIVNAGISIDSEGMKREDVVIHGCHGQLNSKVGKTILIWTTKDYVFTISSNLGKKEVLKIAESVKKK